MTENTENEYAKLLRDHDWHYEFSDDHRWYKKGLAERTELRRIANTSEQFKLMYEKAVWEMMRNR